MYNCEQRRKAEVDFQEDINNSLSIMFYKYRLIVIDTYPVEEKLYQIEKPNYPKLLLDPEPFRGKVLAYNDDYMLIKFKHYDYRAVALKFVTEQPAIGARVEVIPYQRHLFNGCNLSDHIRQMTYGGDSMVRSAYMDRVPLPISFLGIKSYAMKTMIQVLNSEVFNKISFRTISEVLVDANTSEFTFNNPSESEISKVLPQIKFKVKTDKLDGYVFVSCDESGELYKFTAVKDEVVIKEEANLTGAELMKLMIECVDDASWQKTIVKVIKR